MRSTSFGERARASGWLARPAGGPLPGAGGGTLPPPSSSSTSRRFGQAHPRAPRSGYTAVRTNYNAFGAPPSFIEMLTWIYDAPAWDEQTAYLALDGQADLEGFRLNYAWDDAKAFGTDDGNGL